MTSNFPIHIEDYNYPLNAKKIADYPLENREDSKLLILKDNKIQEDNFKNISSYLPENSLMVFNNTKVIQARMQFYKESGAAIEVFCLEAAEEKDIANALNSNESQVWKCMLGNAKKWKSGNLRREIRIKDQVLSLEIEKMQQEAQIFHIRFSWNNPSIRFGEIIEHFGETPLPPYIKRKAEADDKERYQCIYAKEEGSVAAPTAGLHYTTSVLKKLAAKNIQTANLILHVSAGTFRPVKTSTIAEHQMHTEKISVERKLIKTIIEAKKTGKSIIAVGTTTLRSLESLYWHGVKILCGKATAGIDIKQWEAYELPQNYSLEEAYSAILENNRAEQISGQSQLIIVPGYHIRSIDILNTNFHQPKSTLLLLVAAFIGDKWKDAYDYALKHDFRFLSYGDSCLFFKE